MTYAGAIRFLSGLQVFGARPGLDTAFKLASAVGNPQDQLRFIHVAGTNGKGSTCALLEGIYRAAGLRVGLYTSPHLVSFRERIQINRQLIRPEDVVRLLEKIQAAIPPLPPEQHPTFFEVVTVMALLHFAEQRCELILWETGLGGRLDATNIVTPLVAVITNIGLDHQRWLGDTLEAIAAEKAGIIKLGVPAITAAQEPAALGIIEQSARRASAPLKLVTATDVEHTDRVAPRLGLPGAHQRWNAATALAVVETLRPVLPVSDAAIRRGLETVQWPGRLQRVERAPGRHALLDGAHNPAGMATLCAALRQDLPGQRFTLVFGTMSDKDWALMLREVAPLAGRILLPVLRSPRAVPPAALVPACRAANSDAETMICASTGDALAQTAGDALVLVTGSLYLVGEAIEALGLDEAADERELNEYGVPPMGVLPAGEPPASAPF